MGFDILVSIAGAATHLSSPFQINPLSLGITEGSVDSLFWSCLVRPILYEEEDMVNDIMSPRPIMNMGIRWITLTCGLQCALEKSSLVLFADT